MLPLALPCPIRRVGTCHRALVMRDSPCPPSFNALPGGMAASAKMRRLLSSRVAPLRCALKVLRSYPVWRPSSRKAMSRQAFAIAALLAESAGIMDCTNRRSLRKLVQVVCTPDASRCILIKETLTPFGPLSVRLRLFAKSKFLRPAGSRKFENDIASRATNPLDVTNQASENQPICGSYAPYSHPRDRAPPGTAVAPAGFKTILAGI